MEFTRTKAKINDLESKQELTIVDVLAVFEDLCADSRDINGKPLPQAQLGDADAAVSLLRAHGRILLMIAEKHPEVFEGKKSDRFKDICDKLGIQEQKLDKAEEGEEESCWSHLLDNDELIDKITVQIEELKREKETAEDDSKDLLKTLLQVD